jgi:hypothetical protein
MIKTLILPWEWCDPKVGWRAPDKINVFIISILSSIHCQFPTEMSPLTRCAQPAYNSMQLFSLSTFALTRMGQATGMATHVIKRTLIMKPSVHFFTKLVAQRSLFCQLWRISMNLFHISASCDSGFTEVSSVCHQDFFLAWLPRQGYCV